MKVTVEPFGAFKPSAKRNSKSNQKLILVDRAGKPIKGDIGRHYMKVYNLQQIRFDTKFEAFTHLKEEELKELYLRPVKPTINSNTDKGALAQAYYNVVTERYKTLTVEQLQSLNNETTLANLNEIEKKTLFELIQ